MQREDITPRYSSKPDNQAERGAYDEITDIFEFRLLSTIDIALAYIVEKELSHDISWHLSYASSPSLPPHLCYTVILGLFRLWLIAEALFIQHHHISDQGVRPNPP
jgi:hypothetical protein